jgi:tetratricopeptide (TPR) repeat protein
MRSRPMTIFSTLASLRWPRPVVVLGGALLATAPGIATSAVDINRANDYYANKASPAVANVELNHLGPCEKRLAERDYPRTLGECGFILKVFPNHPTALLLTTQACSQWKSPKCMLDDVFDRAVAINPRAATTFVVQGIYRHQTRQYEQAIQSFTYALGLDPNSTNAHYNMALTYLDTKQFELANEHAQKAYSLGATLPGLRERLMQAGYWKPIPSDAQASPQAKTQTTGTAAPADAAPGKQ